MEKLQSLKDLVKHDIDDIYSAEEQILEALPAMIEKAQNPALKKILEDHRNVTEEHKNRLDRVKQLLNEGNEESGNSGGGFLSNLFGGGQKCKAMQGIIEEGQKVMAEDMNEEVMDAAIIACAQKVEHYEITSYGTLRAYTEELGLQEVTKLLEQTLNEEYDADDRLTELATGKVNLKAEGRRITQNNRKGDKSAKNASEPAAKKSAPKKAAPKKATAKKAAPKKAPKAAKSAPKKAAKKAAPKKAAPKKAASKR